MAAAKMVAVTLMVALLACASAREGSVLEWLSKNPETTRIAALLKEVGVKDASLAKSKLTMLVPTNAAVEKFLQSMGLTSQEFLARKTLVDLVLAYHTIPGYTAKDVATSIPRNPTLAVTGDVNYPLRFSKSDGKASVEDAQGNKVMLTAKPVVINGVAIVLVNQVLMSGAYFTSGAAALKLYPDWSEAAAFVAAAGFPEGVAASKDLTLFVPDNEAFKGAKLSGLSTAAKKDIVLYHLTAPAKAIPGDLKSGKLPTLLSGHDLAVSVTPGSPPKVVLTPESGKAAEVVVFNIFAGKAVFQGVNGLLTPKLPGAGRRLRAWVVEALAAPGRRLTAMARRGHGYDGGIGQATANSIAASNTAQAIDAAASGTIPTSYATAYGSNQAYQAAQYGDSGCFNCRRW